MAEKEIRSEEQLGVKWDQCIYDTLVKTGTGLGLGVVFSVFLFKRRTWPVAFGTGVGVGIGYANCQHEFKDPFSLRGKLVKVMPKEE
ncbi:MICOS complex subunit Mic10-like [Ptychodera flava]|uniref:MICOS complex subunit Mic10-like n=1 Tax=Ptychodera flava TaxID=63121 RepID=UPI003969C808